MTLGASSAGAGFSFGGLATQTPAAAQQPLGGFSFGTPKVQASSAAPVQPTPVLSLGAQPTGNTCLDIEMRIFRPFFFILLEADNLFLISSSLKCSCNCHHLMLQEAESGSEIHVNKLQTAMWTVKTLITAIEQKVKSCQPNFMFRLNMSAHSQRRKIVCYTHCIRAVRYDDMYRMDEIKKSIVSIVYFVVSQNTLFTVILFHNLSDCDLFTPPATGGGGEGETERPARTQPGARYWTRDYICSMVTRLSTAVLKQPILSRWNSNNRAICVRRLFLCKRSALFLFCRLWTIA